MKISINTKLSFLIVLIVVLPISYILYSAINIESKEKLNTAYQLQITEAKLAESKFMSIINPTLNTLRNIASIESTSKTKEQFSNEVNNIVNNQQEIKDIVITEVPLVKGEKTQYLYSSKESSSVIINNEIVDNFQSIQNKKLYFFGIYDDLNQHKIILNIVDYEYDKNKTKVLVYSAVIDLSLFSQEFNYITQIYNGAELIYNSEKSKDYLYINTKSDYKLKQGSFEFESLGSKYLGSFTQPKIDGIKIFMAQPLVKVLAYEYQLIQKIALIGVIAILFALIVGKWLSSRNIVKPIQKLVEATSDVANGNFDIRIERTSNDEIGILGDSINEMSSEIKNLLDHKLDAIKLENEVNIAATVQQTLFPERDTVSEHFNINSYYASASACGGDIWNYFQHKNKIYVMIADATGHGLPSAFITVAARTSFSVLESMIIERDMQVSPLEFLHFANHAIFQAAKGKINMTLWMGIIDLENNEIEYVNAAHNSPWIVKNDNKVVTLHSMGRRLGEEKDIKDSDYEPKKVSFNYNDKLFLYTDGINEGTDNNDEQFGKMRMKKILTKTIDHSPLVHLMKGFVLFTKRNPAEYEDDITLVLITNNYKKDTKQVA